MKVKAYNVVQQLLDIWPALKWNVMDMSNIYIVDRLYWLPSKKDVRNLLWDNYVDKYKWIKDEFECNDFSLILDAFIKQERYGIAEDKGVSKDAIHPWAFGETYGVKWNGKNCHHAINICITRDAGVLLVEPQNDKMWSADSKNDKPYYIKI